MIYGTQITIVFMGFINQLTTGGPTMYHHHILIHGTLKILEHLEIGHFQGPTVNLPRFTSWNIWKSWNIWNFPDSTIYPGAAPLLRAGCPAPAPPPRAAPDPGPLPERLVSVPPKRVAFAPKNAEKRGGKRRFSRRRNWKMQISSSWISWISWKMFLFGCLDEERWFVRVFEP